MIIITTEYKGKTFKHKYEGAIEIELAGRRVNIDWTRISAKDGDWIWTGNGFDSFWKEDIVSIVGI